MASNLRVEAKPTTNNSQEAEDRSFKTLLFAFNREVGRQGILKEAARREHFETAHQKKRRKKQEAQARAKNLAKKQYTRKEEKS